MNRPILLEGNVAGYVKANYGEMETAITSMRNISQVIDGKLDALRKELTDLAATGWKGASSDAWVDHQNTWDTAVINLNNLLNQIAGAVGQVRENYMDTEVQVSRVWNNATIAGR